jgi:polyphosphate kinase 2
MKIKYYSAFEDISNSQYQKEKFRLQIELLKLQEWILKYNKRVAVIFEGRDAAGKGSAIKRMTENLMTKHYRVVEIGKPSVKQNNSWFKTYEKTLPETGELVFYDRSWYSRAMIQPAMEYCSIGQYKYFMRTVNKWEKKLINEGLILIKIYLSIDQPTQQKRFDIRKNHLLKYWKLSKNDFQALSNWDTYTFFKNRMFALSAKKKSPWIVINANNKMTARLNALRYVLAAIDYEGKKDLKIRSWNLDQDRDKIKVLDVLFENLNKEQYQLLNNIKQTL